MFIVLKTYEWIDRYENDQFVFGETLDSISRFMIRILRFIPYLKKKFVVQICCDKDIIRIYIYFYTYTYCVTIT